MLTSHSFRIMFNTHTCKQIVLLTFAELRINLTLGSELWGLTLNASFVPCLGLSL